MQDGSSIVTTNKLDKQQNDKEVRENVQISAAKEETTQVQLPLGSSIDPNMSGPVDKFVHPIAPKACKAEAKRQNNINETLWKESNTPSASICCYMGVYT